MTTLSTPTISESTVAKSDQHVFLDQLKEEHHAHYPYNTIKIGASFLHPNLSDPEIEFWCSFVKEQPKLYYDAISFDIKEKGRLNPGNLDAISAKLNQLGFHTALVINRWIEVIAHRSLQQGEFVYPLWQPILVLRVAANLAHLSNVSDALKPNQPPYGSDKNFVLK